MLLLLSSLLLLSLVAGDPDEASSPHREVQEDTDLCRCEAAYEFFYPTSSRIRPTELRGENNNVHSYNTKVPVYGYDCTPAYQDTKGYYVVEDVRVVPSDNGACLGPQASNTFSIFGHRNLQAEKKELESSQDRNLKRMRMGMGASMGTSSRGMMGKSGKGVPVSAKKSNQKSSNSSKGGATELPKIFRCPPLPDLWAIPPVSPPTSPPVFFPTRAPASIIPPVESPSPRPSTSPSTLCFENREGFFIAVDEYLADPSQSSSVAARCGLPIGT
jgi:hypothetical protein